MDYKKTIIAVGTITFFLVLSAVFLDTASFVEDQEIHYLKASKGACSPGWLGCEAYPPVYHFLFGFFADSGEKFLAVNLLFLFGVFPIVLFLLTENHWVVITYFLGSTFALRVFELGSFPSALMLLVWIVFLYRENLLLRLFFLLLAVFIHNWGFALLSMTWLVQLVFRFLSARSYLAISPIAFDVSRFFVYPKHYLDFWFGTNFVFTIVLGFLHLVRRGRLDWIAIILISFVFSMDVSRSFFPASLLLTIAFGEFVSDKPNWFKALFILGGVLFLVIRFFNLNFNICIDPICIQYINV